jgi:hypothetical protein
VGQQERCTSRNLAIAATVDSLQTLIRAFRRR